MNELRWILIGFGIVLLAGIYLWGKRSAAASAAAEAAERPRAAPMFEPSSVDPDEPTIDTKLDPDVLEDSAPLAVDEDVAPPAIRPVAPMPDARPGFERDERRPAPAPAPGGSGDGWRGRIEPTLNELATAELPVEPDEAETIERTPASSAAPTLSMSETPAPRRIERRKILALRISLSPQRVAGTRLLEVLQEEGLQHGKYDVFHRLHTDGLSIFSVASMLEPGTFDLQKMPELQYPGLTLFAQLPGPVPGMHALNELVACAKRLQQALNGTLQDERGVPLTVHRIERLRQEVREFERPPPGGPPRGSALSPAGF